MTCVALRDGILCVADVVEGEVFVRGRRVRFEFDKRFGPFVLTAHGAVASRQPGGRSPFWPAFEEWYAQHGGPPVERGLRQLPDGTWTDGERKVVHLGGRNWVALGPGGEVPSVSGVPLAVCPGCARCGPRRPRGGG